jgi:hypothetical protein
MKPVRVGLLALLAVLALSAVVAASASAAGPEFKPSTEQKFEGTSGTSKLVSAGTTITCSASASVGKITGATTVGHVFVTFTGCKAKSSGECAVNSPGASEGEIKTVELSGKIGAVATSEAESGVGQDLKPTSGSTFVITEGSCLPFIGHKTEVTGSIIGEVSPIGSSSTSGKLTYLPNGSKQKIQKLKGESKDTLSAFGLVEVTEETTESITFEKAVEVT